MELTLFCSVAVPLLPEWQAHITVRKLKFPVSKQPRFYPRFLYWWCQTQTASLDYLLLLKTVIVKCHNPFSKAPCCRHLACCLHLALAKSTTIDLLADRAAGRARDQIDSAFDECPPAGNKAGTAEKFRNWDDSRSNCSLNLKKWQSGKLQSSKAVYPVYLIVPIVPL